MKCQPTTGLGGGGGSVKQTPSSDTLRARRQQRGRREIQALNFASARYACSKPPRHPPRGSLRPRLRLASRPPPTATPRSAYAHGAAGGRGPAGGASGAAQFLFRFRHPRPGRGSSRRGAAGFRESDRPVAAAPPRPGRRPRPCPGKAGRPPRPVPPPGAAWTESLPRAMAELSAELVHLVWGKSAGPRGLADTIFCRWAQGTARPCPSPPAPASWGGSLPLRQAQAPPSPGPTSPSPVSPRLTLPALFLPPPPQEAALTNCTNEAPWQSHLHQICEAETSPMHLHAWSWLRLFVTHESNDAVVSQRRGPSSAWQPLAVSSLPSWRRELEE